MIRTLGVLALLGLAGCGVDGDPVQPSTELNIGVSPDSVYSTGTIGLSKEPINVGVRVF